MAVSKLLILAIFRTATCQVQSSPGSEFVSAGNMKISNAMAMARGGSSVPSKCGLHDFYTQVSSSPREVVADCSLQGDLRADRAKLKQCLDECCSIKNCIGISARSTGTKLVQSFMWAQPDQHADSYMLHEISQTVFVSGEGESTAESDDESSTLEVSQVMMNVRGFPPMASECGRHDFYGQIGPKPSAVIGECSMKGDIRENYHKLKRCLNECCATDSCVGISSTANVTRFVKSFKSAGVDEESNSYVLFQPAQLMSSAALSSESAPESKQGSEVAVAEVMQKAKGWPSQQVACGDVEKRYDFYGGMAGKASAELGDCLVKGDIREDYSKLNACMQMCCNTDKCVGITASSSGTKFIESFAEVDEEEGVRSYMQH